MPRVEAALLATGEGRAPGVLTPNPGCRLSSGGASRTGRRHCSPALCIPSEDVSRRESVFLPLTLLWEWDPIGMDGGGAYGPPWEHSVPLVHQASPSGEVVTRQNVTRGCPRGGREEGGRAGDGAQRGLGQERGRCVAGGEGRVVPSRSSSCPDPWPRSPLPSGDQ